ncbi:hypothetical protein NHH03_20975 [Stieleria sp. TO1_6]|uniref:hypothetical protein n=1 Tax=Stieleria tagensis TaxID=2956795 RepID=UPI00209AF490|nr:hypothetical protein [Stieleria tagensis]MCO8124229.1 hypothetical protein [Stieleria tagensis]
MNQRLRHRRPVQRRRINRRRGSLMVCVLACLMIVASLVGLLVKDAVAARQETKLRLQLLQTERLLDAGILRSAKQIQRDGEYNGETWQPELSLHGQPVPASVSISIDNTQVMVTARIGTSPHVTTLSHHYSSSQIK